MATEEETISPGEVQARKGEDGKVDILSTLLPLLAGTAAMGIGAAKGGSFGRGMAQAGSGLLGGMAEGFRQQEEARLKQEEIDYRNEQVELQRLAAEDTKKTRTITRRRDILSEYYEAISNGELSRAGRYLKDVVDSTENPLSQADVDSADNALLKASVLRDWSVDLLSNKLSKEEATAQLDDLQRRGLIDAATRQSLLGQLEIKLTEKNEAALNAIVNAGSVGELFSAISVYGIDSDVSLTKDKAGRITAAEYTGEQGTPQARAIAHLLQDKSQELIQNQLDRDKQRHLTQLGINRETDLAEEREIKRLSSLHAQFMSGFLSKEAFINQLISTYQNQNLIDTPEGDEAYAAMYEQVESAMQSSRSAELMEKIVPGLVTMILGNDNYGTSASEALRGVQDKLPEVLFMARSMTNANTEAQIIDFAEQKLNDLLNDTPSLKDPFNDGLPISPDKAEEASSLIEAKILDQSSNPEIAKEAKRLFMLRVQNYNELLADEARASQAPYGTDNAGGGGPITATPLQPDEEANRIRRLLKP
tara:strand:+ start:2111 stop:3715 length:1605 start_codon:yes stop_codon:yes gene_type:complete